MPRYLDPMRDLQEAMRAQERGIADDHLDYGLSGTEKDDLLYSMDYREDYE